jgi:hypothetical protein
MKNPILAFRKTNINQVNLLVNLGEYDIIKGINGNSINELKNNKEFSSTLITKTREAADMSESS